MASPEVLTEDKFRRFVESHSRPPEENENASREGTYSVNYPESFVPVEEVLFRVDETYLLDEQDTPLLSYTVTLRRWSPDRIVSDLYSLEWRDSSVEMGVKGRFSETTGGDAFYDIPDDKGQAEAQRLVTQLEELELAGCLVEIEPGSL